MFLKQFEKYCDGGQMTGFWLSKGANVREGGKCLGGRQMSGREANVLGENVEGEATDLDPFNS